MAALTLLVTLALVALAGGTTEDTVDVPPKDTIARVGDNVTLYCEVTIEDHEKENLQWQEYITDTTKGDTTIYNSINNDLKRPDKFEIHGEFNLLVKKVTVEDGGMYGCKLSLTGTSSHNADLIVVDEPNILVPDLTAGKNVTLQCTVKYGSRRIDDLEDVEIPQMRLTIGNYILEGGNLSRIAGSLGDASSYLPSRLTYTVTTILNKENDGHDLTCDVYTEDPQFKYSSSVVASVKHGVTTIQILPNKEVYEVGDVIQCLADGNPAPDIRWAPPKAPSGKTVNANLTLTADMVLEKQTWECTATNTVDDLHSVAKTHTFDVVEPKNPSGGGADKVGVSVATAIVLFAITYVFH